MTDFPSDKECGGPQPAAESPEKVENFSPVLEEGLSIHVVEPDDPGTIFVAVGEPAEDLVDLSLSSGFPVGFEEDSSPVAAIPLYGDLAEVVAVRLNGLGPALFFISGGISCAAEEKVIVAMEEGHVYGTVASVLRMNPDHLEGPGYEGAKLRLIVRKATEKDDAAAAENDVLATEALDYCRECARGRDLDMKLVDVLVLHDRSKMVFYFTAPARIDFRELVKDLVRRYRTRIELRQIGVRHETQMVGALGNCGMVCCCRRYLRKFAPVAIKMAKEQNVFLNPIKISGVCGRLLCCLAYEQDHYDEFYRSCPKLGKKYHTDSGVFRVLRASLFRESVTVLGETGEEVEFTLAEWNALHPSRPNTGQQNNACGRKQEARPGGEEKGYKPQKPEKKDRGKAAPEDFDAVGEDDFFAGANGAGDVLDAAEGSIFGLTPRREGPSESGGESAARRKKPPRRHHRKKPQGD